MKALRLSVFLKLYTVGAMVRGAEVDLEDQVDDQR